MTIFEEIKQAGIEYDFHRSDLYIPVTPQTTEIMKKYGKILSTFIDNIDHELWYELPFAYDPFWNNSK